MNNPRNLHSNNNPSNNSSSSSSSSSSANPLRRFGQGYNSNNSGGCWTYSDASRLQRLALTDQEVSDVYTLITCDIRVFLYCIQPSLYASQIYIAPSAPNGSNGSNIPTRLWPVYYIYMYIYIYIWSVCVCMCVREYRILTRCATSTPSGSCYRPSACSCRRSTPTLSSVSGTKTHTHIHIYTYIYIYIYTLYSLFQT